MFEISVKHEPVQGAYIVRVNGQWFRISEELWSYAIDSDYALESIFLRHYDMHETSLIIRKVREFRAQTFLNHNNPGIEIDV